jgi:hypothetical protein
MTSGLRLHIDRKGGEWVETCKSCGGAPKIERACRKCHGTGTRATWVEGNVEVVAEYRDDYSEYLHTVPKSIGWVIHGMRDVPPLQWVKAIIDLVRANALPASLLQSPDNPDGLRIVHE